MQRTTIILFLAYFSFSCAATKASRQFSTGEKQGEYQNKIFPEFMSEEVETAIAHYPELKEVPIEFRFKKIKKSYMQARPKMGSIFRNKEKRKYVVLMSRKFNIENEEYDLFDVPSDVLIGWLSHELGHIMDYRERSGAGMIVFGFKYIFSRSFLKEAERTADLHAIDHGLLDHILATKKFIFSHASFSEEYKAHIKKLYLSPQEISDIAEEEANMPRP